MILNDLEQWKRIMQSKVKFNYLEAQSSTHASFANLLVLVQLAY